MEEETLSDGNRNDVGPQRIRKELQSLHNQLRWMIIYEHYNDRDQSRASHILRELNRFYKVVKASTDYAPVDKMQHERIKDGFLCFQDFCKDHSARLQNRRERVQNLTSLVSSRFFVMIDLSLSVILTLRIIQFYNLMQNHDSTTNIKIASASANIAQESKRDSAAMKTIAVLTTVFLPATFVAALFSANIFTFARIPERAWQVYIAVTIPLTASTLVGWVLWIKWRERKRDQGSRMRKRLNEWKTAVDGDDLPCPPIVGGDR